MLGNFLLPLFFICIKKAFAIELLLNYPEITGAVSPNQAQSLPQLIRYIYLFSIGIVGITALLAIIIGAINYVTSAGNPSKAQDAKDRIYSAIIGVILLLASVMILRTINPDLVNIEFTLPKIPGGGGDGGGTSSYKCLCCRYYGGNPKCDPETDGWAITDPNYWPTTCRTLTLTQANSDCSPACYNLCGGATGCFSMFAVATCP